MVKLSEYTFSVALDALDKFKMIHFELTVDRWYTESSWNIWSMANQKYVYNQDFTFKERDQVLIKDIELQTGTYKLCVKDAFGDGGPKVIVTDGLCILVDAMMTSGYMAEFMFDV